MFLKYRATCCTMSVEPSSYASVTARPVLTSELFTMYDLNLPPLFSEQNGNFSPKVSFFSNFFSISLLCNLVLSTLSLQKQIRKFQTSQNVPWFLDPGWFFFFFNYITNFRRKAVLCHSSRSSYPLLFSSFALHQWVGLLWYCLRQLLWKLASHAKKKKKKKIETSDPPWELLVPFIFCSFMHWHLNTVAASVVQTPFSLIFLRPSLLQKIHWGFKIAFSKTMEECQEVLGC